MFSVDIERSLNRSFLWTFEGHHSPPNNDMKFHLFRGGTHWLRAMVATLSLLLGLQFNAMAQPVVFSEIMYHPPSTNLLEQWFEIQNVSSSEVDLSGWQVTKGVGFTFPISTHLTPGGFLVIAADVATFHNRYPSVANVIGGWSGTLGHSLELSDASGAVVDAVNFFSEGDWAIHVLGDEGILGNVDVYGGLGWSWLSLHDGLGASLELIQPNLSRNLAANWSANLQTNTTPGKANSVASENIPPIIYELSHTPVIPKSSDPVLISAHIVDDSNDSVTAMLHWRLDGAAGFTQEPLYDDGSHGDALGGDHVYSTTLPPHATGTIVEFYVTAADLQGQTRVYPSYLAPAGSPRTANALFQVDDSVYTGSQPVYRIVMTETERQYLETLSNNSNPSKGATTDSDATMNATWITSDGIVSNGSSIELRYNVGVRNRGHGSRSARPHNFHVNIPDDRTWKKQSGINLNSQYSQSQVAGSAVFRLLGIPMADSRAVQLRVNGTNQMSLPLPDVNSFGAYAANEQYNNDFIKRSFPLDSSGNSYRGIRDQAAGISGVADFSWHGTNWFVSAYTNAYYKQNHLIESDYTDLLQLISVLNVTNGTTSDTYVADVRRVMNVDEWMRYMAINTLLANNETCLANGIGDDYALYRGAQDTRFLALPYDLDDVFGTGQTPGHVQDGIFRMTALPAMDRFMKTPEFVPRYFYWLRTYAQSFFAPENLNPWLDRWMNSWVPQNNIDGFKSFNAARVDFVLGRIPSSLTVTSSLTTVNGYLKSTQSHVDLAGSTDAAQTYAVDVNGFPATYTAWQGSWSVTGLTLTPGLNRIWVVARGEQGQEVGTTSIDIWYDDSTVQSAPATVSADTTWTAASGPYLITSGLTINAGATLTIQPGTTVYLGSGANLTIANGGRLNAIGTSNSLIRFTRAPGANTSWGGIVVNGGPSSPESRLSYVHIEFNGTTAIHSTDGTLFLDHLTFGTTDKQYVSLDHSSFVVQFCHFPKPTAGFEPMHGTGGIKTGGYGVVRRNYFGSPQGYNDVIDFTGCNRPGPIIHFINNVFEGASDDVLDLDGTDAWVEGNLFLHVHKNGSPDSSSAVSGGKDSNQTSEVTILNNLLFDCDQAATGKEGNFFVLLNNTIVHETKQGGLDTDAAVVNVADEGTAEGAGMYLEGNILYDIEKLARNVTAAKITFTNNLMPLPWTGLGGNNLDADPLLTHVPSIAETQFQNWEEAQILRSWFLLQPGSPAYDLGPNHTALGGNQPLGVSLSGVPKGTVASSSASIRVGSLRTGSFIPTGGFPGGSGYTHYKYRLDGGAWSGETPISTPITLQSLPKGPHFIEVTGKRDSGVYQDDPLFGSDGVPTRSEVWIVDPATAPPSLPSVRINEVLASNAHTYTNGTTNPDWIELYNDGSSSVDLGGMGLTDSLTQPYKYVFPAGTLIPAGGYLIVVADNGKGGGYLHCGFSLKASGDDVSLFQKASAGGAQIDRVEFGIQLTDLSIGRGGDGNWVLCQPTLGKRNLPIALGDPQGLRINEWLTDAQFISKNDFVELYNPAPQPVNLGGFYLSDSSGSPARHRVTPLSFVAAQGWVDFIADSDPGQGSNHLNFKLSPEVGLILLSDADLHLIDGISYGPQRTDVSEGRTPDGSTTFSVFDQATPGAGNPGTRGGDCVLSSVTVPLVPMGSTWKFNQTTDLDGIPWQSKGYDDSSWESGPALLAVEDCGCLPVPGIQTPLTLGRNTYYFRTHFVVESNLSDFALNVATVVDDGAIVYLNGSPFLTNGMPAGSPTYATAASRNVGNGASEFFTLSASLLVPGTNVLAAEVHQVNKSSSDIVWGMSLTAVKTFTNCSPSGAVSIVLNEILTSNQSITNLDRITADYIELLNTGTNSVDVSNFSLTDDSGFPRKWVFPVGSIVQGGAYSVIYCTDQTGPSSTNTGFNLKASGGAVFLFSSPERGGSLVDGIHYGLQTPDYPLSRIPNGTGNWTLGLPTANGLNFEAALASASTLRINEWMADPVSGSDWFEIYNPNSQPVALGGLFLTDDLANKVQSPIPPLSYIGIGADAFVVFQADGKPNSGPDHVSFSLKKSGESLGLFSPAGVMLDGLNFGSQSTGVSEGRFPDGASTIVRFPSTASPGESNFLPLDSLVISEILTHTDPPLEDAIEFYNSSQVPIAWGGWYLSNSKSDLKKYRIPDGASVPANGYAVLYEHAFGSGPGTPFTFNSAHGDSAILSEADSSGKLTGYRIEVAFGPAANGVSFGRFNTSTGVEFTALSSRTFGVDAPKSVEEFRTGSGLPNAPAKVGPIVINEIHFRPIVGGVEVGDLEYIELQNITPNPIPMYDPNYPTNVWRLKDAVDFSFASGFSIQPNGRVLIVGFDPADTGKLTQFRSTLNVDVSTVILGPWDGQLDNDRASVELVRPDAVQLPPHPDAGFVPQILVDKVHYVAGPPWPFIDDGTSSLQKVLNTTYGNDPANWKFAAPTPGRANSPSDPSDTDQDGLPDDWERTYFGDLSHDGTLDSDGDGLTDLQEYLAGTNPVNPEDTLRFTSVSSNDSGYELTFNTVAGRTYSILFKDAFDDATWIKLTDVTSPNGGAWTVTDTTVSTSRARFYRLVTPAIP